MYVSSDTGLEQVMSCLQLLLYMAQIMTAGRIWYLKNTYIIVLIEANSFNKWTNSFFFFSL